MDDERPLPLQSLGFLKQRVDDAKLKLDFATSYLKEVQTDLRSGALPSADPEARKRAIQAKRTARGEYSRVMQIYQDFITRRKGPHANEGT